MKSILMAATLLLCTAAYAQDFEAKKAVVCSINTNAAIEHINEKYGEELVWGGASPGETEDSIYMLFENPKTKSWTLTQMNAKAICIIGVGEGSKDLSIKKFF